MTILATLYHCSTCNLPAEQMPTCPVCGKRFCAVHLRHHACVAPESERRGQACPDEGDEAVVKIRIAT